MRVAQPRDRDDEACLQDQRPPVAVAPEHAGRRQLRRGGGCARHHHEGERRERQTPEARQNHGEGGTSVAHVQRAKAREQG